jgi:AraC-like DNA-binding protein
MAQECGLSISHFARSFKAAFGISAHRRLVHRRVERSNELMTQTAESLAERFENRASERVANDGDAENGIALLRESYDEERDR